MQIVVPANFLSTKKLKKNFPQAMRNIKDDALKFWETEAGQTLNSSRERYLKGITAKQTGAGNIVLTLNGAFPVMIEHGAKSFDMKVGFSKSNKLKPGPIKIPASKRTEFSKDKKPISYQWMIIPIEDDSGVTKFRTFTTAQPANMWLHPGLADGANLIPKVKQELKEEIIPRRMAELIKGSFK